MSLTVKLKGKRKAVDNFLPPVPVDNEPPHPTKRVRQAETRRCPICGERIPLRLLSKHAELESERVENILNTVGSSEVFHDKLDYEPGPSSQTRRSAIKARKSITTRGAKDTLEQTDKTIQTVKRRRRQRHGKLKEMAKEEEEGTLGESWLDKFNGVEIVCPVCSTTVRGDQDVVNAHVDACVAHESLRLEDVRQRTQQYRRAIEDAAWDDEDDDSFGNYVGNLRGAGFHRRNRNEEDVDDEVDIEGDDQAVYGEVQFTEGDVLPVTIERDDREEDVEVNIEDDEGDETQQVRQTLRELVAASDVGKSSSERQRGMDEHTNMFGLEEVESVIASARQKRSNVLLAAALENKIKFLESARAMSSPSLQCRICLDPYAEPTLSTGCWHTCCRECWLRCLGSTKLCPICKRITCATDLRRIYL